METEGAESGGRQQPLRRLQWPTTPTGMNLVGISQVGLFVIAACYVIHETKSVLLPLVLAILVSLIVHPIYLAFRKLRLPRMLSAAATVSGVLAILAFGAYQAFLPGADWLRSVDKEDLVAKVQTVFKPVKKMQADIKDLAVRVEQATGEDPASSDGAEGAGKQNLKETSGTSAEVKPEEPVLEKLVMDLNPVDKPPFIDAPAEGENQDPKTPDTTPVKVEIHEDPFSVLMKEIRSVGLETAAFLLLVLFVLAYGNRITRQFTHDERLSAVLERMSRDVSRYLFTITIINAALGICIGFAMWGLGLPHPAMWGVMAMLLNYIPYFGALVGTMVIFLAAVIQFERPGMILATPIIYFLLTALEGNLITPTVLGGRFKINPLVVFVWIFAWTVFWGFAGMLIAMPALVIFKIVCEDSEKMKVLRRVLEA